MNITYESQRTSARLPIAQRRVPLADGRKNDAAPSSAALPLVIDLDGTLIKTDSTAETLLDALRHDPSVLWRLPRKLSAGCPAARAFLAGKSSLDVETWPVHEDFLEYVRCQADEGRTVVLATSADQTVAEAIAKRFPFISEVIASDGVSDMKGADKAKVLQARFPGGYVYAGASAADLAVWEQASASIVVDGSSRVVRSVSRLNAPLAVFPRPRLTFGVVGRGLRVHQWAKNLLTFIPLLLGGKAGDPGAWFNATLGFLAFGLVASGTYIINDLWDLPGDRRHWSKHTRPLASGKLSIGAGLLWAALAMAFGFGLASSLGLTAVVLLAVYVVATLGYSLSLKRVPILDVTVLAGLFTLRLEYGIVLADVRLSPWLLVFSMFVFTSLSMAKRHAEVLRSAEKGLASMKERGYLSSDAPLTLGLGLASMLGALLIMVLYLIEDAFPRGFYAKPAFLWALPPILFLFLGRVWLLCQRGQLHDDPVEFATRDRVSVILGIAMTVSFLTALLASI
jgi:4-hydroxybenzoate polyprenyltransferase/phosphoserine phosphatase